MIGKALDRLIAIFSPERAIKRISARGSLAQIEAFSGGTSGYEAGRLSRLTKYFAHGTLTENAVPPGQLQRLRALAWDLYRNNPHARKIVRSLEAKVVGPGLHPISHARKADGSEFSEFRQRASKIWHQVSKEIDYRGRPGKGGLTLDAIQKQALRTTILSGETLYQIKPLTSKEQRQRGLTLPLELQLIHSDRLGIGTTIYGPGTSSTARIYRGIELDNRGRRVAYWLYDNLPTDPSAPLGGFEATRYPADDIGHLYFADDIDQLRGVPWFAPSLLQMRDTSDYQYNELKASALAACVAMGIRRASGASNIGLNLPTSDDTVDGDSNTLTAMQPGMIINLGDGELQAFNPARPTTNAEAWIQHMLRSTGAGLPGIKSSTITGDYRNSSFSSERSADNDAWPELEGTQAWLADNFCQPIYEQVIVSAVLTGLFVDVVSDEEFNENRHDFLAASWQGPVPRSINPTDDAKAARLRIQNGQSSPQIEAAALGRNWRDVIHDFAEFVEYCEEENIPPDILQQFLGIDQIDSNQPGGTGENAIADNPAADEVNA